MQLCFLKSVFTSQKINLIFIKSELCNHDVFFTSPSVFFFTIFFFSSYNAALWDGRNVLIDNASEQRCEKRRRKSKNFTWLSVFKRSFSRKKLGKEFFLMSVKVYSGSRIHIQLLHKRVGCVYKKDLNS